jgi:hypothetical protein
MSPSITITNQDLIQQLKLSGKVPEIVEGIIARKIITETATAAGNELPRRKRTGYQNQNRLNCRFWCSCRALLVFVC